MRLNVSRLCNLQDATRRRKKATEETVTKIFSVIDAIGMEVWMLEVGVPETFRDALSRGVAGVKKFYVRLT